MTTVLNVELKLTKEEKEKIVNECLDILNERFIEELEKIKAETLKLFCDTCNSAQSCYKTDSACYHQCVFEEAFEDMINSRIAELKGENNE